MAPHQRVRMRQCRIASPRNRFHIGMRKVVADEQQWFAARHGQGVAETISKIERGPMTSTPERSRRITRDGHLIFIDIHDVGSERAKQYVEVQFAALAEASKQHQCCFDHAAGRDESYRGLLYRRDEPSRGRFVCMIAISAEVSITMVGQRGTPYSS